MPLYEVAVIIRNGLKRPELKDALKRVCGNIHGKGGVIHSMEHLGEKALPTILKKDMKKYEYGNYFFVKAHLPLHEKAPLSMLYKADVDVLTHRIMNDTTEPPRPCLYKPCIFGEVVKPAYDRSVYKSRTLKHLKNKTVRQ